MALTHGSCRLCGLSYRIITPLRKGNLLLRSDCCLPSKKKNLTFHVLPTVNELAVSVNERWWWRVETMRESEGFMGVRERACMSERIPTVSLFLEDLQTSLFSRQLKRRSNEGRTMERWERTKGLTVGDSAPECCSGFNYRQRNSLFKYLENRRPLWLCVHARPCENVCVCAHVVHMECN